MRFPLKRFATLPHHCTKQWTILLTQNRETLQHTFVQVPSSSKAWTICRIASRTIPVLGYYVFSLKLHLDSTLLVEPPRTPMHVNAIVSPSDCNHDTPFIVEILTQPISISAVENDICSSTCNPPVNRITSACLRCFNNFTRHL